MLALELVVVLGAALLRTWGTWWSVLTIPLYGVILAFLFCAAHECVHRTAFLTRGLNDTVAALVGATLIVPSAILNER